MLKVRSDLAAPPARAGHAHRDPGPAAIGALLEASVPTGIISNPRSHRNRLARGEPLRTGRNVFAASPRDKVELRAVLERFVGTGVGLVVIDGGDGTVRDVLSVGRTLWGEAVPRIAVIPAGKTNALAHDLGIPPGWSIEAALAAAEAGRSISRAPLVVRWTDDARERLGFVFGAGAFVSATELAQHTHRAGAFNGLAVGLALGWTLLQTLFGSAASRWRAGEALAIGWPGRAPPLPMATRRYIVFASTFERFPLGLRPLGPSRPGLKTLVVDAPPRLIALGAPALVAGAAGAWMRALGYHHIDGGPFTLDLDANIILDGELYAGGAMQVAPGAPIRFVVP